MYVFFSNTEINFAGLGFRLLHKVIFKSAGGKD